MTATDKPKAPGLLDVTSVVQEEPLGLGHAIAQAEQVLDPDEDAVAVLLPDDLVLPGGVLEVMARTRARRGGSVLCAIEVPEDRISATMLDMLNVEGIVLEPAGSAGGTIANCPLASAVALATGLPLTSTPRCETSWRAEARVTAKPMR